MKHCPHPDCPFRRRHRHAAEYRDDAETCADCGGSLADGAAPAPARIVVRRDHGAAAWRRLLLGLGAVALVLAAQRVPLPGIDLERLTRIRALPALSIVALGLWPALNAFILVEIVALIVPSWRPLRHGGPEARRRLAARAWIVAVLLAAIQAYFIATWLCTEGYRPFPRAGGSIVDETPGTFIAQVAVLAGVSIALMALAWLVSRHGPGNGYALLFTLPALVEAVVGSSQAPHVRDHATLAMLAVPAAGAAVTVWLLTGHTRRHRGGTQFALREPTSGVLATHEAVIQMLPLPLLVGLGHLLPAEGSGTRAYDLGYLALGLVLTVLWSYLFNRPWDVAEIRARVIDVEGASAMFASGAAIADDGEDAGERAARRQLLRATWRSFALPVLYFVLVDHTIDPADLLTYVFATAVIMDVAGEWRARRRHGELVPAWPVHQVHAVDPALAVLERAGIPAYPRGAYFRALLHFFGPFVPVEILVSPAHRDRADRLLESLFLPPDDETQPAVMGAAQRAASEHEQPSDSAGQAPAAPRRAKSPRMKLYYAMGTCSHAAHIALREAGLPFSLVRYDMKAHALEGGGRLEDVNEKGYVPVLELDDGERLTEVAAILQYVADRAPERGLAPPAGTMARYRLQEWLNFIATEIHKIYWPLFHDGEPVEKDHARAALDRRFTWVEHKLGDRPFLLGDGFTVADAYLVTVLNWTRAAGIDLAKWPRLAAYRNRIRERPAVQDALRAEGLVKRPAQ